MIERQEIHCHNCDQYVQFDIDMGLNGNHVLECPNCGHEHCRVVKDGVITGDRWDSRNGDNTYTITWTQTTPVSMYRASRGTGAYTTYTTVTTNSITYDVYDTSYLDELWVDKTKKGG